MMSSQEELQKIRQDILDKLSCPLKDAATNMVFGKGNPQAKIFFVGEAPGEQEDLQGLPFVGRAGKELDKLLHTIGLTISDVYIANILKYRPPKNRNPTAQEMLSHTPYLVRQIKAVNPRVIVTLGNFSTRFVLNDFCVKGMNKIEGISLLHGQKKEIKIDDKQYVIIPLYHPAAMLYRPQLREVMKKDFKKIQTIIKSSSNN